MRNRAMRWISRGRVGLLVIPVALMGCVLLLASGCHGARTEQERSPRAAQWEQRRAERQARQVRREQNVDYLLEGARRREAERAKNLKAPLKEVERNARGEVAK